MKLSKLLKNIQRKNKPLLIKSTYQNTALKNKIKIQMNIMNGKIDLEILKISLIN